MGYWTHATATFYGVKNWYDIAPYSGAMAINMETENGDWPDHYEDDHLCSHKITISISDDCDDSSQEIVSWFLKESDNCCCSKLSVGTDFRRFTIERPPSCWDLERMRPSKRWIVERLFDTFYIQDEEEDEDD